MRLAWVSACPWANTGYGKVTREFMRRIKYPDEKCIITLGGFATGPYIEWEGIKCYPGHSSDRGRGDVVLRDLAQLMEVSGSTHWVFHSDAWAFRTTIKEISQQYPCMVYSPIDGGHVSAEEYTALAGCQERVAMSKYADVEIKKTGLSSTHIPHGVNTAIYKPQDKMEWREVLGLPKDKFIFGFVGTNISKRKGQAEIFMGLKKLYDAGLDFVVVMVTNIDGQQSGGYNLWQLADYVGLPRNRLLFPKLAYTYTEEEMAGWYNAFDILLNLSRGEGFGIPMLESQACGTPVIANDFSSMTELVGGHGILIPPKTLDVYTLKTQYLAIGDPEQFAKEAQKCIENPDLVKSMGKRAHKFAQQYDWDKIAPRWDRLFKRIDNEGYFPPYNIREYK